MQLIQSKIKQNNLNRLTSHFTGFVWIVGCLPSSCLYKRVSRAGNHHSYLVIRSLTMVSFVANVLTLVNLCSDLHAYFHCAPLSTHFCSLPETRDLHLCPRGDSGRSAGTPGLRLSATRRPIRRDQRRTHISATRQHLSAARMRRR